MKKSLATLLVIGIVGCSSTKTDDYTKNGEVYKLNNYRGPEALQQNEVIQASKQCVLSKMRPNIHYLNVKTEHGKTMVPVNVTCEMY